MGDGGSGMDVCELGENRGQLLLQKQIQLAINNSTTSQPPKFTFPTKMRSFSLAFCFLLQSLAFTFLATLLLKSV